MPIPKALVARREEMNLATAARPRETRNPPVDRHRADMSTISEQVEKEEGTCQSVPPTKYQPSDEVPARKKGVGVKWKDLPNEERLGADSSVRNKRIGYTSNKKDTDKDDEYECDYDDDLNPPVTCRQPNPSSSLTLMELERHILKQESSIRRACELELKLLNQCTRVREKRSLMVQRLRQMKRKMQKLANADQWTTGMHSFPPEYYDFKLPSSKTIPSDKPHTESSTDATTTRHL